MNLRELVQARLGAEPKPSWCAIFTLAYARLAAARPELRRAYLSFPVPHLYEHPLNVASVAVERTFEGEAAVFFTLIKAPESKSLLDLERQLREAKERPVEDIGSFRRILTLSSLPLPLRRLAWWFGLNVWGRKRAHYMGTFGVSVYSGLGAASLHPLSPLPTTLNYGVIDADGNVDVRLIYDHRVMDGGTVARCLADMEQVLCGPILEELRQGQASRAA
jgi:hypothetical protein